MAMIISYSSFNIVQFKFQSIYTNYSKVESILLRNLTMKDSNEISSNFIYSKQLKSFQIEQSKFILDKIQSLIALMDQLIHLKLEGFTNFIGEFFQTDQLEKLFERKIQSFQFFIRYSPNELIRNNQIIESFIQQFQKPFWISHLNSDVNADWIKNCYEIHFIHYLQSIIISNIQINSIRFHFQVYLYQIINNRDLIMFII